MISTFCVIVSDGEQERVEGLFTDITAAEMRCRTLVEQRMASKAQVMLMSPATGLYGEQRRAS